MTFYKHQFDVQVQSTIFDLDPYALFYCYFVIENIIG